MVNSRALIAAHHIRRLLSRANNMGRITWQPDSIVGPKLTVTRGKTLTVDECVAISSEVFVGANVHIGPNTMISSRVALIGDDHPFNDPSLTITDQTKRSPASIVLGGDNLIGFGSIIIGDSTICRGAIVAAGSVVVGNIETIGVYAGIPARRIGDRYK